MPTLDSRERLKPVVGTLANDYGCLRQYHARRPTPRLCRAQSSGAVEPPVLFWENTETAWSTLAIGVGECAY